MSERSFKNSGIRFGHIYGIELWIHWTLLIWFAYILYGAWIDLHKYQTGLETMLHTLFWWLAVFGTILIHELGHCYAAFRNGGGADAIVLWPLGGLAYCDAPQLPWNQFWVAAGGPLMQLLPITITGAIILTFNLSAGVFPSYGQSYVSTILGALFWWNLIILAFNLLPIYPLDGGRIFQSLLWWKLKSHGRASLITVWTSRITIIVCGLFSFIFLRDHWWPVFLVLIWAYYGTERLKIRLVSGEESEDHVFGYDFSRGYTSLERTSSRGRPRSRPSILNKIRERSRTKRELQEEESRKRVDRLLEKIHRGGMASLSRSERKFLEQASKKFKSETG